MNEKEFMQLMQSTKFVFDVALKNPDFNRSSQEKKEFILKTCISVHYACSRMINGLKETQQ